MGIYDDPNYSSSIGGGSTYSSTGTPAPNTYSSTYTAPVYPSNPYPPTNYPNAGGGVYTQTQTSSNLFGNYHTRRHHTHGNQHIDDVRYDSCCTII